MSQKKEQKTAGAPNEDQPAENATNQNVEEPANQANAIIDGVVTGVKAILDDFFTKIQAEINPPQAAKPDPARWGSNRK